MKTWKEAFATEKARATTGAIISGLITLAGVVMAEKFGMPEIESWIGGIGVTIMAIFGLKVRGAQAIEAEEKKSLRPPAP